ncbi:MAG: nucleotidyltransferase [Candidatus Tritonobacter lacicola]|nr:nucleotidyltransferase [Candidatus Tritonobacter lacicola]
MADIQKQFEEFNDVVRLKQYEHNANLREKRDVILKKLKERLKVLFEERDDDLPKYTHFDQGSYKLGTGVKPLTGDFDIDVGLLFEVDRDEYRDPVVVKQWVYDALDGHTKKVEMRRPCVTVFYQNGEEPLYHVDLAVYSAADSNFDNKICVGKGKQGSPPENCIWEEADPDGLITVLTGKYSGDDWEQFRRCLRYLKRWKDLKFPTAGNAAPVGIGLTIAAYNWFYPKQKIVDNYAGQTRTDDLGALLDFANAMLCNFNLVFRDGEYAERIEAKLPVVPYGDVFEKMSNQYMTKFKEKLQKLVAVMEEAMKEADPVEACKKLQKVFGDDFPVPERDDTGAKRGPAIITSSHSA